MPRIKLTELGVARMKPPPRGKQLDITDAHTPGLSLRISYGGAKAWKATWYEKGRARSIALGRFPILSVAAARKKASAVILDPKAALRQERTETFEQIVESFMRRYVRAQGLRSADHIESRFTRFCYPVWKDRPFEEIRRRDVSMMLDSVEDGSGARTADLVLAHLSTLCNWYAGRSDDYQSPIVKGMKRSKPQARRRKLTDDEIRGLWAASADLGTYGAILKMLLLTGQRREKIARMKWSDLSDDGVWTVDTEPREKGNFGKAQLPSAALDIIAQRPRILRNSFVFGAAYGRGYFNVWSKSKEALDVKLGFSPWVLHDLRRTARSLMSRAGVQSEHAERVLGHAIRGVEGVYDQHDYFDEKNEALVRLSVLIMTIIDPPARNVVPIRALRAE
jgi:integrase